MAGFRLAVADLYNPLPELQAALKKAFRGIRAVGIGRRRRERSGDVTEEVVVKIVVTRKQRPLPKGVKRIPRRITIVGSVMGREVSFSLPTDVDQVPKAVATRNEIGPFPEGSLTTSAYATWSDAGQSRYGIVTAGHGLWTSPTGNRRKRAPVQLGSDCSDPVYNGRVLAASHLKRDGLDVGLIELDEGSDGIDPRGCLQRIWPSTTPAGPSELVALLGNDVDTSVVESRFKLPTLRRQCEAIAYYNTYTINVQGWGSVTMKGAVESTGPNPSFEGGTSGAGIVTEATPRRALGIQSLSLDPSTSTRGLATSFAAARDWLRNRVVPDLELTWDENKLTD